MTTSEIRTLIAQTEANYGLPSGLLDRLVALESSYNPNAYNSASGASGLTQIIKRFHPTVNNPFDPYEALNYTAQRLSGWYAEFGNWQSAVAAWHAGETAVRNAIAQGKPVPGTVDRYTGLPTSDYASRIVGNASNDVTSADLPDSIDSDSGSILKTIGLIGAASLLLIYLLED